MPLVLLALDNGADIVVGPEPIILGRHPQCDVRLLSFRVSRRHCCLAEVEGGVAVLDLGSSNGTEINGRRIDRGRMELGDLLSLPDHRYRLEQVGTDQKRGFEPEKGLAGADDFGADIPGTSLFREL